MLLQVQPSHAFPFAAPALLCVNLKYRIAQERAAGAAEGYALLVPGCLVHFNLLYLLNKIQVKVHQQALAVSSGLAV